MARTIREMHRPTRHAGAALMALVLTAGCAGQTYPAVDVAEANARAPQGARLEPGDRIRITVFDEPTLTGEYDVGSDGSVTMPLISQVPAAGHSAQQLGDAIGNRLTQGGYVIKPRIAVDVLASRPFYILGEVNKPGEYTYVGEVSLLQAIAKAGGFTPRAQTGKVVVRRKAWQGGRTVPVGDPGLIILPGDTITVQESLL